MTLKRLSDKKQTEHFLLQQKMLGFGLPLATSLSKIKISKPTNHGLKSTLSKYVHAVAKQKHVSERELEAIQAFLLALYRQYPTFFRTLTSQHKKIMRFFPTAITGRMIKLKRIAEAHLAGYL